MSYPVPVTGLVLFRPIALGILVYNFGLSECKMVKRVVVGDIEK